MTRPVTVLGIDPGLTVTGYGLVLAAAQAGLPVTFYKPLEVKQFVTSYGRGSKEQVAMMVQALLGLSEPPTPADAADALAVALTHCLKRGSPLSALPQAIARR